jgi:hypothetical protein
MCNSNNANICKHKFAKLPKKTYNQTAKHKSTTNALIHKDKNKIYKSVRDFKTKKYKWIAGLNNNILKLPQKMNIIFMITGHALSKFI